MPRPLSLLRRLAWATTLLLAACGGGSATSAPTPEAPEPLQIEVIVRSAENFRNPEQVRAFVAAAARQHVAVINVLAKQDEDASVPSGATYYPSRLAPAAPGWERFDVLATVLAEAAPRGIRVHAWLPQFHDQVAARAHPDWAMRTWRDGRAVPYTGSRQTEYFVNPLSAPAQAYQRALLEEVLAAYPALSGVMLDWIRFDNYDMDLGDETRRRYQALGHPDPVTIDWAQDSAERRAWNDFRTTALADYVHSLRARVGGGRHLGVYILPPEFVEVGQDSARFAADVDSLQPMCYFRDWGFPLDWWWSSCLRSTQDKAGATAIVPVMDSSLSDDEVAQILAHLRSQAPNSHRLAWFHHETWDEARLARIARWSGW